MLFLATPHRGSASADTLNNILRTTPGFSAKLYISELERSSSSLQDINEQFRTTCTNVELVSLYETQRTNMGLGVRKLVCIPLCHQFSHTDPASRLWTKNRLFLDIRMSNPVPSMPTITA